MIGKKINQLATELAPVSTDLTIIGDPTTGVSKKITLAQLGAIFSGAVSFYTNLAGFPAVGDINVIYCAKDTKKLYLWSGSAYVEVFPSQALLDTYQLRSEKGNANGYASLDSQGKVPISQLPSSIMEYKGTWSAATNTPTLANGTGDTGDVYICNAAGSVNFGAGAIAFAVGDYVIYSGTIWQRSSGAVGTVTSVAVSRSGDALAITGSPVTTSGTINVGFAGNSTQYINGAGNLVTFPGVINEAQNLITEVYNKTGATLTKGTVVYINGGQGNLPTITKALATGDSTSAQTYGIVRNDITNNNNGYVVVAGRISDLDTQAYTEGTQLYLSSTTAGTYTSTKQYAPNHLVYVGIVVRAHPTQGVIEVKIQNGYELDELHNVAAQSPSNGDILQYVSSTSLWTKVAGTTSNIAEGTNLYYTDARSRAALSFTAGSGAYNSTTGVITIPTNTNQLTNGANYITLSSLSASSPLSYNNGTGAFSISQANTSTNGFLSSTDWNTFNGKQAALNGTGFVKISGTTISYDNSTYYLASNPNAYIALTALSAGAGISYNNTTGVIASTITQYTDALARAAISLTTTGTSGAATYNSTTGVLNVPQYAPDLSGYVPTSRTLTINGTAYDLSANRSWSVGTVTSVGLSSATTGVTIGSTPITTSGTITLAIATASGSQQGLLSSTDWTTFNNKQNALTNPVTGTGTTNYLPKFTGASTIGNSILQETGTNVTLENNQNGSTWFIVKNTNSGSGAASGLLMTNNGGDLGAISLLSSANAPANALFIRTLSTNPLVFGTGNTERMRLDASGNLGLGVTPSAWGSSSFKVLDIGSTTSLYYDGGTILSENLFINSSFQYIYKTTNFASRYDQVSGTHKWFIAPSGTAGNAISFTQAMTLGSNSGLSIGTTTAASANGLRVAGDSTFSSNIIFANTNTSINYGSSRFFLYNGTNTYVGDIDALSSTASLILRTNGIDRLTILASTGAATFSSSVTAGGDINANTSSSALKAYGYQVGKYSYFGYSSGYPGVIIGNTGAQSLFFNVDISGNPSGAFSGNGSEYVWRNSGTFLTPNSTNNGYNKLFDWGTSGQMTIYNAATFSSSVTAGDTVTINTPSSSTAIALRGRSTDNYSALRFQSNNGGTTYATIYSNSSDLIFENSGERMRITSGGSVLIGTTTEGFLGKLQVAGSVAITGQYNTVLPSSSFSYFDGSGQVVSSASSASALYLDTTWNTTGNPDGIYLNVTNTASGASSKLLNLKVGSVSQFSVSKAGAIQTTAPSSGSAQPWKLGSYAAGGTGTATGVIYIEINGQIYSIPALQGTP